MTKYSFVLLGGESENFLSKIQELGVIDITRSKKPVDEASAQLFNEADSLRKNIARIEKGDFTRDSEYNSLVAEYNAVSREYNARLPWGTFSPEKIEGLGKLGFNIHYYCASQKKFSEEWAAEYPLEVISRDKEKVYFVTFSTEEDYSFPISECDAPSGCCDESAAKMAELEKKIEEKKAILLAEKDQVPELKEKLALMTAEFQRYLAKSAAVTAAENVIDTYIGFAPTEQDAKIAKALDEIGVYYFSEPATKEDNPPIKLKNNWFARNFETLTGMYGMPVYDEFDPTPVLAPFFMLFWAMCMGDSGYGLLLIAVGFMLKKVDLMGLKKHWRLVVTLGVGATVIGLIMGTFMGVNLAKVAFIPESIKSHFLTGKLTFGASSYDVMMIAAIVVGVVHLSLAMVIKAIGRTRRFGIAEAVSSWGWVILIVGGLCVAGLGLSSIIDSSITKIAMIVIGIVSGLSIYIFNKPGNNPLKNVGAGLWNTYEMATGLLGDVLSYIRLYALGLAGGMLGEAFNNLGGMILGSDPTWQYAPYVLVLVFGHAINFAMACLGAFVHPLRLTFVEYFKNCGYEGRGTQYEPLTK